MEDVMGVVLFILLITISLFIHVGIAYIMISGIYDLWDFEFSPFWKLPIIIFWPIGALLFVYGLSREWIEEILDYHS
jgi:hypothetical protein